MPYQTERTNSGNELVEESQLISSIGRYRDAKWQLLKAKEKQCQHRPKRFMMTRVYSDGLCQSFQIPSI